MKNYLFSTLIFLLAISVSFAQTPTATLTNNSGTNADVNILVVGGTATLQVAFTGTGPWNFALYDGRNDTYYTATSSPFYIQVSPSSKRRYNIQYLTTNSGNGSAFGVINVIVGTNPSITLTTPSNLTTCIDGMIEIPFTQNGTWQTKSNIKVEFYNSAGTSFVASDGFNYTTNPIKLQIPSSSNGVGVGSYKIRLVSDYPYVLSTVSSYNINVTSSSCQTPQTSIYYWTFGDFHCTFHNLRATPSGAAYSYQWYKNGNLVTTNIGNNSYWPSSSGIYSVRVTNSTTGYDQTSDNYDAQFINYNFDAIASNSVLCGSNNSTLLTSPHTGTNYQWLKIASGSNNGTSYKAIIGANSSTYTATTLGDFKVEVSDGDCKYFATKIVSNGPICRLLNSDNVNGGSITIPPNSSTVLRAEFEGIGPWTFQLQGSDNSIINHVANSSPYFITVSPNQNTNYKVINLSNSCGAGAASYETRVIVSPPPTFAITATSAPSTNSNILSSTNTNICPGSTIPVTYSIAGTWSADREMTVELLNASTNALIAGTTQTGYATNPILYHVPSTIAAGAYKIRLTSVKPFITSPVISNAITISSTACAVPQATVKAKVSCSNAILTAAPTGVGYTFQWFKDGNNIANATSETYTATENGNYTVAVSNTGSAYSATSAVFPVAVNQINGIVTVTNGQICENSSSITLTSSNVGGSYTHQWYYSPNNVYFQPIASATNNTYTTSLGGFYYDIIKNGTCEVKSNVINTCPISINFIDKTVCNNSVVNVPFTFLGGENQSITLQLVNATTNAVIISNLFSLVSTFSNTYNPSVIIPNTVVAGNYKFRITSGSPTNYSNTSLGIITISGQSGGTAPTVTASLSSVSSSQNVTISVTGCQFDVNWNNSDGVAVSSSSFSRLISKSSTFSATCTDINTGCISQAGSTTVTYSCADAYEPNNSIVAATAIAPNTFTSPVICLNGFDNPDWFSWSLNGHVYYIKASLISSQVSAGNYKLKLTYDNANLIIETIPETVGQSLDTYLTLFDTDGVTVLSMNDNGNGNGFSKIIYGLININPCVSALTLNNITDDYSSGTVIKEANSVTGTITATNKITNAAKVTYRAGKSITLNAGFKADNGVVFKTEFGGCN